MIPKFSIVIPTYNRADQLVSCLDSLLKQSYPLQKCEVIVVDDNSKDETQEVLSRYSRKFPNLRVIRNKENKGPYYSRNLGVSLLKGEIVAFTDSDCILPFDWLLKIEKMFQDRKVLCLQGTQKYGGKFPGVEDEGEELLKRLQKRKGMDTKNLAIRRNLILKYRFDAERSIGRGDRGGDSELGLRLNEDLVKILYAPHITVTHVPSRSFWETISRGKEWGEAYAKCYKKYGWKSVNPKFRYPLGILFFYYSGSFFYFLLKKRSLRGAIAAATMLLLSALHFKKNINR